ncbi:MAG: ribosomal-processing cysteine protease Prp [Clostridia bacterium]|nr:ribosomal-processing cysteine protease Prp [Clostridia bacterium]
MIKITIFKKNDMICEYQVKGHSGYAEAGFDIVCSGVSTATEMTLKALQDVLKLDVQADIKDGYMHVIVNDYQRDDAQNILKAMELTLEDIANQYVKNVKLEVR